MKRQFTAGVVNGDAEIVIYDVIGGPFDGGVTATSIKKELDAFKALGSPPVTVHINSPGGEVYQGIAIYNLLKAYAGRVIVQVDGIAASAASVIAMAGDDIVMAANAIMMIHSVHGGARGTAEDLRGAAEQMERLNKILVGIYTARTGQPEKTISALVTAGESNFTAEEALALNLATAVSADKEVAAQAADWLRAQSNPVPTERKQPSNQGTQMNIVTALGFKSDEETVAAFGEIRTFQNGVVSALGAANPADAVQRLTALQAKAATADALQAQVTSATLAAEAAVIEAQVQKLDVEKKLAPALVPFFRSLDAKSRETFIANAVPVVASAAAPRAGAPEAVVALTPEDEAMLAITGQNRKAYTAARAAEKGQ